MCQGFCFIHAGFRGKDRNKSKNHCIGGVSSEYGAAELVNNVPLGAFQNGHNVVGLLPVTEEKAWSER